MAHPLFTTNAPKAQTSVVLPVNRNGASPTPFSYRQARRYGQNERTTFGGAAMMMAAPMATPMEAPMSEPKSKKKSKAKSKNDD